MSKHLSKLRQEVKDAFLTPTLKQKEAYGRFCHTLASASVVGFITVLHLDTEPTFFLAKRAIALFVCGLTLFLVGSVLSKGE